MPICKITGEEVKEGEMSGSYSKVAWAAYMRMRNHLISTMKYKMSIAEYREAMGYPPIVMTRTKTTIPEKDLERCLDFIRTVKGKGYWKERDDREKAARKKRDKQFLKRTVD